VAEAWARVAGGGGAAGDHGAGDAEVVEGLGADELEEGDGLGAWKLFVALHAKLISVRVMKGLRVFCADIGSVRAGRFGWAASNTDGQTRESGSDIRELAQRIVTHLDSGGPASVGFECPLFVPLREDPNTLTAARKGDGSRAWSAGAGTGALATGLVEVSWILREVRRALCREVACHLDWRAFGTGGGLFLWEAFVSAGGKPQVEGNPHAADAMAAVEAFVDALPDPTSMNAVEESDVISLLGMALLRTGWTRDVESLGMPCLVIKPSGRDEG